ncbi:hypothetical protein [Streptomyces chilikensis]|uniref:C2H2-type domain-containing protein n=1 Tax=Streptomyces chilikensis TaxID=1194079 RepID=A0ABV3ERC1_9ACTN
MTAYLTGCWLKTAFPSRRTARRRARQIRGEGGPHFRTYRCHRCAAVHLAHKPGHATHLRTTYHGPINVLEHAA